MGRVPFKHFSDWITRVAKEKLHPGLQYDTGRQVGQMRESREEARGQRSYFPNQVRVGTGQPGAR